VCFSNSPRFYLVRGTSELRRVCDRCLLPAARGRSAALTGCPRPETRRHLLGIVSGRIELRISSSKTICVRSSGQVLKRTIGQVTSRQCDASVFQVAEDPRPTTSPKPEVIRKICAENSIKQVVELLRNKSDYPVNIGLISSTLLFIHRSFIAVLIPSQIQNWENLVGTRLFNFQGTVMRTLLHTSLLVVVLVSLTGAQTGRCNAQRKRAHRPLNR
jgi:hypothetical protein